MPAIIGVGESSERLADADYAALSPVALACAAARAALDDAGVGGSCIDIIASVPQFEVSGPYGKPPFGASDNFARSVARGIGAEPRRAILEAVGGQAPQHLVNECAAGIARGAMDTVLLVGAEALSTVRHLQSRGERPDWSETVPGQREHRDHGLGGLAAPGLIAHGATAPVHFYALFENARRARQGLGRAAYGHAMAELFAPFTTIAAANPHTMSRDVFSAADLATVTAGNRLIADPYTRRLVSRDQVNQGAAVLLTSRRRAAQLGVASEKLIYLNGSADVQERSVLDRQDLSRSPAAAIAVRAALSAAALQIEDMDFLDLYSCFPVAVFNICDAFGLAADGRTPLTITGGLPYFGGAGSNYSMHAIAGMVRKLRQRPEARGLIGANGGFMSKYSVGVYAAEPGWSPPGNASSQAEIDGWAAPPVDLGLTREVPIETYTIDHTRTPPCALIIGRTGTARTLGSTDSPELVTAMIASDPIGGTVTLAPGSGEPITAGLMKIANFRPGTVRDPA